MRFSSPCNPRLLDHLDTVVSTLVEQSLATPEQLMVVGATARDIIHSSLGHKNALRLTSDSDIGIVLSNWDAFHSLEQTFAKSGDTNIRFLVKGIPVDIMPFGDIENPTGYATPANRKEEIRVFAFSDVYKQSEILALPSKNRIHIPTPAGYAVLKLRAWIDRSPEGDYKDAVDLATVAFWYAKSQEVETKLWDEAQANDNCPPAHPRFSY